MSEPLLTVKQIAARLSLSESQVRTQCRRGGWPHVRLASSIRFTEEQFVHIILSCRKMTAENWDSLPRFGVTILGPGIYLLTKVKRVVYVGQAVVLAKRIGDHAVIKDKDFDDVIILPCPLSDLDRIERRFIRLLKPHYNVTHNSSHVYDDDPQMTNDELDRLRAAALQATNRMATCVRDE